MKSNTIPPYCYKKEYLVKDGAVYLVNEEPAIQYIDDRVSQLVHVKTPDECAEVKRTIFREFNEIYTYDLETADIPEPFGIFADEEEKNNSIERNQLIADFFLYLGTIFCNYHTALFQMKKIPIVECERLVIDYTELYHRAVGEYYATLCGISYPFQLSLNGEADETIYKRNHACGTTFILPALIEHFLLMELQNRMLLQGLDKTDKLIKNGSIILLDDETNLLETFMNYRESGGGLFYGKQEDTLETVYRIFAKYGIIEDTMDNHKILTGTKLKTKTTLGSLLHSDYAGANIRPEYFNLISILFDSKKLNLRNCITHGNSTAYDYLAIEIAAVMMQLLWDIDDKCAFVPES